MSEDAYHAYKGVKFRVEFLGRAPPSDRRVEELKRWCRIFAEKNLAPPYEGGSYGNLSFRMSSGSDSFIITGSKIGLKDSLTNDCFVRIEKIDMKNGVVHAEGSREPSSESMVHYAIYQHRPEVNAIFHGHCAEITACTSRLGIPETCREEPYGTIQLVERVVEIVNDGDFFQMKNHGFVSLGKTMDAAGDLTLEKLKMCRK
jgi:ribulose-5-phosphate 4-epimerase/fuculose-1-phosphate aldolase